MSTPLTARELLAAVREAKDNAVLAVETYRNCIAEVTQAEYQHEIEYATAFTEAKESGATDSLAKQRAILATSSVKKHAAEAKGKKQAAYALWQTWQKIVEAHAAASYALNQELKLERTS